MFVSRRAMLTRAGAGFGMLPLTGLVQQQTSASEQARPGPHFAPQAKRVIFLFMNGAPSHVDTFDPKPKLAEVEGQQPEGMSTKGNGFMPSPFRFAPRGESGVVMSELFPQLASHADDLCVIRSMHTDTPNHEPGLLLMHSGHQQPTRPCLGSWASYGLGTENENLPAFVALCPGLPVVGPQLWSSAFLPGNHQALSVNTSVLTALGNDYGFEKVFSRQLEGLAEEGDVFLAITTSGESPNIINALKQAKIMNIRSILISGNTGGASSGLSDISILPEGSATSHIQECHMVIYHIICNLAESKLSG